MSVGVGRYANPRDGDVVEIEVDVTRGAVAVTRMDLRCCDAAARAARELASLASGKTPEAAALVESREVISRLALVEDEERCALTAIAALRAALVDAHVRELA